MAIDDFDVPENIKRMLRQSFLEEEDLQPLLSLDVFELELFEWYVKETDQIIDKMLVAEQACIQEQLDAGREHVNDSGIVAANYYLRRIRYSHVIYLTSLVETFLSRECTRLSVAIGERNLPFKLEELSGNQWKKKRKFLERYGNFTLSDDVWRSLDDLIILRNSIVHDNGMVSDLSKKHRDRLKKYVGIKLTNVEVVVEPSYVKGAFASVRKLCEAVDRDVSDAIRRARQSVLVRG